MTTFLLDTNVWLFMSLAPRRLRPEVVRLLLDPSNQLLVSLASCWEIAIKYGLGRLALPESPEVFIPKTLDATVTDILPISLDHVLRVATLPRHHRDPFDRLLVAQAMAEGVPLVSSDPQLARYPVQLIPA
ncbi:MAG TPA: type II toxin-antitoxin system VapC family toxin [Tepidiformaceae bacterium]|nr:type II toxin-antitoxin system VapC family toxin [Tepidiformaceae bacterium]